MLEATAEIIDRLGVPYQNCVLAHVSTQMEAIRRGAPAGSFSRASRAAEGPEGIRVTVELLDEAYARKKHCKTAGPNVM
jgi:ethanolamine ammonia-lyase large subunit